MCDPSTSRGGSIEKIGKGQNSKVSDQHPQNGCGTKQARVKQMADQAFSSSLGAQQSSSSNFSCILCQHLRKNLYESLSVLQLCYRNQRQEGLLILALPEYTWCSACFGGAGNNTTELQGAGGLRGVDTECNNLVQCLFDTLPVSHLIGNDALL